MDFETRRLQARTRLDAIDPHRRPGGVEADPKRREWFEAVYRLAGATPPACPGAISSRTLCSRNGSQRRGRSKAFARSQIEALAVDGLTSRALEAQETAKGPHWRAVFEGSA